MTNPLVEVGDRVEATTDEKCSNVVNDVPFSNGSIQSDSLQDDRTNFKSRGYLSAQETWNVIFCFLAWACNVSIVTLGASACFFLSCIPQMPTSDESNNFLIYKW